ncbi:MAG: hypothetical protein WKF43_09075 [Acidimicrobiales bacterium]
MTLRFLDRRPRSGEATLSQRVVRATSSRLGSRQSRRSFLTRTAVLGSALAVNPWGYILRPGTAYGAVCGTCSDGWTAFCCTINSGRNSCPPDSFVAGWWKADNAAYCCGKARYIIDCNATCPTQCSCRCTGASCDGRRTCCNQFRYGQCHQEISCYGPVVCRVATCTPPWQYDSSCTTSSATDNRTVSHGAPCLPDNCTSAITKLYESLGGANGILGPVVTAEKSTVDGTGRFAHYRDGSIFQRDGGTPHEMHGAIADRFARLGHHRSALGYPTTNEVLLAEPNGGAYNRFENGIIYASFATGTFEVVGAIRGLHSDTGGVRGPLGYPTTGEAGRSDGIGRYQYFQHGSIWVTYATGAHWLGGRVHDKYRALDGPGSPLGYPTSNFVIVTGGYVARFESGSIYERVGGEVAAVHGRTEEKYRDLGEHRGLLRWPVTDVRALGPGFRTDFEQGSILYRPGLAVAEVHGSILVKWDATGSNLGPLGWPLTDVTTLPDGRGRVSRFQKGSVYFRPGGAGTWEVHGPIHDYYRYVGETESDLGYPRGDVSADGDLSRCTFDRGRLTYDPDTGAVTRD